MTSEPQNTGPLSPRNQDSADIYEAYRQAENYLLYMKELGLGNLSLPLPPPPPSPARPPAEPEKARNLTELALFAEQCRLCPLGGRGPTYFGLGALNPPLMIIVDPPDLTGFYAAASDQNAPAPAWNFLGSEAAVLLGNIITKGIGLKIPEVYVTPILKCQPENPELITQKTKNACFRNISREIALVNPKTILAMGLTAGQVLTAETKKMYFLRPKTYTLNVPNPITLRITLGLNLLLEDPGMKRDVWQDLQKTMRLAGLK
ncbi:MAG: hypothetical protein LBP22_09955 [Deltaproteobacteria bacterium]|nr:hypothetical protein [Deltaproteobacteria bacterium]